MKHVNLTLPTFGFVVATRALIGVGVGLLIAERFRRSTRLSIGRTLLAIGAASTVPALIAVIRSTRRDEGSLEESFVQ